MVLQIFEFTPLLSENVLRIMSQLYLVTVHVNLPVCIDVLNWRLVTVVLRAIK